MALGYEYLDHTADIQVHSWAETIEEAFENAAVATMGYMTELETVEKLNSCTIYAEGHDIESLLFNFLDEVLGVFSTDPYMICKEFEIIKMDKEEFKIEAKCYGETFNLKKHPQGTEIKAITYSNLQIKKDKNFYHIFVILDI